LLPASAANYYKIVVAPNKKRLLQKSAKAFFIFLLVKLKVPATLQVI